MDACSDYDEHQFFDAPEEIPEISDFKLDCPEGLVSNNTQFDVWVKNPESVETRRSKFLNWLGFDVDNGSGNDSEDCFDDRIMSNECWRSGFEVEFSTSRSSMSCWPTDDSEFSENSTPKENFARGIGNLDGEIVSKVNDHNRYSGSDRIQQTDFSMSSSSSGREFSPVKASSENRSVGSTKRVKKWWLSRLRSFTCAVERGEKPCACDSTDGARIQRVKVHQSKKQSKELSGLYYGQKIQAHRGAILTMKFSPDGQFLASAGVDRIVRVWKVVDDDRSNEHDIPEMDPSCVYLSMDHRSELKHLSMDKAKAGKLKINSESACVILPPKVFRILEKPLHEFHGHTSEILDISWSNNNCLLSSSVDKTVRLWQIGLDNCINVFPHNNYVTCVQFNPVDENYFISGSIDGKVRIWEVSRCKVVNWTEIKDIVTAVCYCSDGQGGIIGSIIGSCRFYTIADNQLQLGAEIFLHNKKKSYGKRITGFQFLPHDPSKVMVSCADSQIRIIKGATIIGKYKGLRSAGSYSSAFFTADGTHIVSASEDNNVYMWKYNDQDYGDATRTKKVKSCERFLSNASVALPWPGLQNDSRKNRWQSCGITGSTVGVHSLLSPAYISCGQEFFLDSYCPKGSALWPEEMLLASGPSGISSSIHKTSVRRSEYEFLRTCQSISDSNAWGLVIVTAGWDGRIRSFHNYGLPVPQ